MTAESFECLACGDQMRAAEPWVWRCRSCSFMMSTLQAGAGRGVSGLKPLRLQNFEKILDVIEQCTPRRELRLLEVGSAEGWFLERAIERRIQVEGVEPTLEPSSFADAERLNIRVGYFPDALDADDCFDCIVFNDVFEHFPDPVLAIKEVERRLNAGGLVVLNLPSSKGFVFRSARILYRFGISGPYERLWQKGMDSPHITYYCSLNLKRFVERHTRLRHLHTVRLLTLTREGLWRRLSSTYSTLVSAALTAIVWPASFVLRWFPPDAELVVFERRGLRQ